MRVVLAMAVVDVWILNCGALSGSSGCSRGSRSSRRRNKGSSFVGVAEVVVVVASGAVVKPKVSTTMVM